MKDIIIMYLACLARNTDTNTNPMKKMQLEMNWTPPRYMCKSQYRCFPKIPYRVYHHWIRCELYAWWYYHSRKEKRLGIAILVVECLAIRKALMIAMKKNLQGIIMEINSQLTVNAIDRKNQFWKILLIFLEDITNTCPLLKES